MKLTIRIEHKIECGETTCYHTKKPCRFVGQRNFGTEWCCLLFNENDEKHGVRPKTLTEKKGCLQRLPECLSATV